MRTSEESRSIAIHSMMLEIAEIELKMEEAIKDGHLSIKVRDLSEAAKSYLRHEKKYIVTWVDPYNSGSYVGYWKISCEKIPLRN